MNKTLAQQMLDAMYADANMTDDAALLASSTAALETGTPCRVILAVTDPDFDMDGVSTRLVTLENFISVRTSEVPELKAGNCFVINGDTYQVIEAPARKGTHRLEWEARCRINGKLGG